ncbi:MAG: serine/threonine-protein kinase, partial [Planctomycetota bacterium]
MPDAEILFGRFRVRRLLGRGGCGSVHLVEDTVEGNTLKALKLVDLPPDREDLFHLLRREFEILAKYNHPHLTPAFEIGREDRQAYFSMAYVEGPDLLEASTRLPLSEILRLSIQILRALAFLHGLNLIHGDVKPQNILVDTSKKPPFARLLDLGIAETLLEAEPGHAWGTPAYIAPEKILGAPPDPRSDLYSFGVTLYQLLTGALPFQGETVKELHAQHRGSMPTPLRRIDPSIPPPLEEICLKLLAKDPRFRFPSAEAVHAALAAVMPDAVDGPESGEGRHLINAVFAGREEALGELWNLLEPSQEGTPPPTLVAIQGPGGIGKTRLAREFSVSARVKGYRVLEIRCKAHPRFPLEPLAEAAFLLSNEADSLHAPDRQAVKALLEGGQEKSESPDIRGGEKWLSEWIKGVFESATEHGGFLAVLEDFHLALPELVDFLFLLLNPEKGIRGAFLVTAREKFTDPQSGKKFHARRSEGSVGTVTPAPFLGSEVSEWVETALPGASLPEGTAEELVVWAKGNPFLIREALLAGVEGGRFIPSPSGWRFVPPPPGESFPAVGQGTEHRFANLPPRDQELVAAFALHPGEIEVGLLEKIVAGVGESSLLSILRGLVRSGWIVESKRGRAFSIFHDRLRRPVQRALSPEVRARLHRETAACLEGDAEEDEAVEAMVAEHWARAGVHEKGEDWCYRAGRVASHMGRYRRSLLFLRAAYRSAVAIGRDPARLGKIGILVSRSATFLGNLDKAEAILHEMDWRQFPVALRDAYLNALGATYLSRGKLAEAHEALQESLKLKEASGQFEGRPESVELLLTISMTLNGLQRYEESVQVLNRALTLCGDFPTQRGRILVGLGRTFISLGRLDEAFDRLVQGVKIFRKFPSDPMNFVPIYFLIGNVRVDQGITHRAFRWYKIYRRFSERFNYAIGDCIGASMTSRTAWILGKPALAYREAKHALDLSLRIGDIYQIINSLAGLHLLAIQTGRHDLSLSVRESARRNASKVGAHLFDLLFPFPTEFLLRAGRIGDARKALDEAVSGFKEKGFHLQRRILLTEMALDVESGRPERVLDSASAMEEKAGSFLRDRIQILGLKARALADLGREKEAKLAFQEALENALERGHSGDAAGLRFHQARWLQAKGDPSQAFKGAIFSAAEAERSGRIARVWQALHLAARALEALEQPRRAAKFFRRALWRMETEAMAFPEPYRSSFTAREDCADLIGRTIGIRAEDTARRLAARVCAHLPSPSSEWVKTTTAWAASCAGFLGADAAVFQAQWGDAHPKEVVFGKPQDLDETRTLTFGGGGPRQGSLTLYRRWERGPFIPVALRNAPFLLSRLAASLERGERKELATQYERSERIIRAKLREAETVLATAQKTLSNTQTALG